MNVKHKRHIFYFLTKKKIDKNLLSRRKRAIAIITYAGDKAGFRKSGHICIEFMYLLFSNLCIYYFKIMYLIDVFNLFELCLLLLNSCIYSIHVHIIFVMYLLFWNSCIYYF